jgi:hypothetical protein
MAKPETDIFTPFVFINIMGLTGIEGVPFFSLPAPSFHLNGFDSMASIFIGYS